MGVENHVAVGPISEPGNTPGFLFVAAGVSETSERLLIPKKEREALALEVNTVLSGVDRFLMEASKEKNDFIIDMYNIPPIETSPIAPDEGARLMRELAHRINRRGIRRFPPEWVVGRDQLLASAAYLEERDKPAAEITPYRDYVQTISGMETRLIPSGKIERERSRVIAMLKAFGFNASGDEESVRKAFASYHTLMTVRDEEDLIRGLKSAFYPFRARFATLMRNPKILETDFETRIVREDAPFMAWERVLAAGNFLDINYHETKRPQWGREELERYARHEGSHFIMGDMQAAEIEAGRLDSIAGYILIPGPACWPLEGIAQAIDDLSGIESNDNGKISTAIYRMYVRARTNALYYVETRQKTIPEAVAYMLRYSPQKSEEEIAKDLTQGTTHPLWRPYLPIYGHSDWKIMNLAEKLNVEGKRAVLNQLLTRPMTYSQFDENWGRLAA